MVRRGANIEYFPKTFLVFGLHGQHVDIYHVIYMGKVATLSPITYNSQFFCGIFLAKKNSYNRGVLPFQGLPFAINIKITKYNSGKPPECIIHLTQIFRGYLCNRIGVQAVATHCLNQRWRVFKTVP